MLVSPVKGGQQKKIEKRKGETRKGGGRKKGKARKGKGKGKGRAGQGRAGGLSPFSVPSRLARSVLLSIWRRQQVELALLRDP